MMVIYEINVPCVVLQSETGRQREESCEPNRVSARAASSTSVLRTMGAEASAAFYAALRHLVGAAL